MQKHEKVLFWEGIYMKSGISKIEKGLQVCVLKSLFRNVTRSTTSNACLLNPRNQHPK